MRKLNQRQLSALKRVKRGVTRFILPEIAKSLEKRGLVIILGTNWRTEWGKRVPGSTLTEVALTPDGEKACN